MSIFNDTHPELTRLGIKLDNVDSRYKPVWRMGISIDEMIYIARRLYPLIKDGRNVLDLACGNGLITVILSKLMQGSEFHAIDDWEKVAKHEVMRNIEIDNAKINLSDFRNGYELPYRDEYFDVVYSVMFLSNIGKEGRTKIGNEVKRVLRNDGRFVIVDTLVFRGKIKKELASLFNLEWYGEENGFSFFLYKRVK
ncbi:class I SAM-dependent methyltransferase [Sulfolobus tengchongensis]|uniref:Class I SAM-dependent methyltransferase n=1 Tax=Sulfolobus tengchongensis TaxID=207809 RepID=A0AAX4KYW3_9CREN